MRNAGVLPTWVNDPPTSISPFTVGTAAEIHVAFLGIDTPEPSRSQPYPLSALSLISGAPYQPTPAPAINSPRELMDNTRGAPSSVVVVAICRHEFD
jgi:hypothetical protein